TIGVILGGRLGFVLFYEPGTFIAEPWEIPRIDKGGMAFHGALLGCGLAIFLFANRFKDVGEDIAGIFTKVWRQYIRRTPYQLRLLSVIPWSAMDVCSAATPIGLFFGRIANFINGELYGRPTSVPWGMVFPGAARLHPDVEPTPRHPSQLY